MNYKTIIYLSPILVLLGLFSIVSNVHAQDNTALLLEINGTIDLGTAHYIKSGIETAHQQYAHLIILQLNTSSDIDKHMRSIINAIEVSQIPVVAYVAPSGARASNAGTFILFASPIAAMAPGTNIGPASQKITKDNIVDIRNLAQRNDHNADWAELAVSSGASLAADAALANKVINVIAEDVDSLLKELNGSIVKLGEHSITLNTTALTVTQLTPNIYSQFLSVITYPIVWFIIVSMVIVIYNMGSGMGLKKTGSGMGFPNDKKQI